MNRLTQLRDRMGQRTPTTEAPDGGADTDRLGEVTEDMQAMLQLRWWRWRHHFLVAKKLELEDRHHES